MRDSLRNVSKASGLRTTALEVGLQDFSEKSQVILDFGHIWPLSHVPLCFCFWCFGGFFFSLQPFKNVKSRLSSWAIQKQALGQIWPANSNLLTMVQEIPAWLPFSAWYSASSVFMAISIKHYIISTWVCFAFPRETLWQSSIWKGRNIRAEVRQVRWWQQVRNVSESLGKDS